MGLQQLLAYTASPAKVSDQLFPRSLLPVHMSGWHPNTQGVHIPCYHAQSGAVPLTAASWPSALGPCPLVRSFISCHSPHNRRKELPKTQGR